MKNNFLTYTTDNNGIATITINQTEQPTNLFSFEFIKTYLETAEQAIANEKVKGIIITSGRPIFMAGADLRMLLQPIDDPETFFKSIMEMSGH